MSNYLISVAMILLVAAHAWAQPAVEVRIGLDEGAVYDGIIDGFPGIAALDGIPDLAGNLLGVALRNGTTEERGVAEFPLATVPRDRPLTTAVLTFNIDDVLSTFGPGTEFSGRAAATIYVHVYAADGVVEVADFNAVSSPAHAVDTTVFGVITDAAIAAAGPFVFAVDITDDAALVLASGASHLGVVFRVEDSPTGTSLDDLGDGSAGPPGVGGAELPYVTLHFVDAASPTAEPATPTPTPTLTPTPPPTPSTPSCAGDCSGDGAVTVDEVVALVGLALGAGDVALCQAGDSNGDGQITVDEIVNAIAMALGGCPLHVA